MLRSLPAVLVALVLLIPGLAVGAQDATPAASPTSDCPTTTEEQNAAIARRWHEDVLSDHDLAVLEEILSPTFAFDPSGFPDDFTAEQLLGALLIGFPDMHHTIDMVLTQDNFVGIRYSVTGTHLGEFQGFAPTGETLAWTGINFYEIECGRIAKVWSEIDSQSRSEQLVAAVLESTPAP